MNVLGYNFQFTKFGQIFFFTRYVFLDNEV